MKSLIFIFLLLVSNVSFATNNEIVGKLANQKPTIEQLCTSHYTTTIRPSTSYTTPLKRKLLKKYNLVGVVEDYQLDHKIPLILGGEPKGEENLWMQPKLDAKKKDKLEIKLYRQMCKKQITLEAAQKIMFEWVVK